MLMHEDSIMMGLGPAFQKCPKPQGEFSLWVLSDPSAAGGNTLRRRRFRTADEDKQSLFVGRNSLLKLGTWKGCKNISDKLNRNFEPFGGVVELLDEPLQLYQ